MAKTEKATKDIQDQQELGDMRLTQPLLDPMNTGRVVMDYVMKLVTTALEWSYQAAETDVRAEGPLSP